MTSRNNGLEGKIHHSLNLELIYKKINLAKLKQFIHLKNMQNKNKNIYIYIYNPKIEVIKFNDRA